MDFKIVRFQDEKDVYLLKNKCALSHFIQDPQNLNTREE